MLHPAKKYIKGKADKGSLADAFGLPLPKKTGEPWKNDDSREDQVNDEDEVPGVAMFKKG